MPAYDPVEQEPDLEIYVRSQRGLGPDGKAASHWQYGCTVEGERVSPVEMSQTKRDYGAAMLRQIASLVQESLPLEADTTTVVGAMLRRIQAERKALDDYIANGLLFLAKKRDLHYAASSLGMKEAQALHILKNRWGVDWQRMLAEPTKQPDLLAEIAQEQMREKVMV